MTFVPHSECTEGSGECFYRGRCLSSCRSRARESHEDRIRALESKVRELELRLKVVERGVDVGGCTRVSGG